MQLIDMSLGTIDETVDLINAQGLRNEVCRGVGAVRIKIDGETVMYATKSTADIDRYVALYDPRKLRPCGTPADLGDGCCRISLSPTSPTQKEKNTDLPDETDRQSPDETDRLTSITGNDQ